MNCSFSSLKGKIALFGGSFDPVHLGHISMADKVISETGMTSIVFIPAKKNPLKDSGPYASDKDRLEMLRLALKGRSNYLISDIEIQRPAERSYFIETLDLFIAQAGSDTEIYFLIGGDQISNFHLWKDYSRILRDAKPIVFGRKGIVKSDIPFLNSHLSTQESALLAANFVNFDFPCSSTSIRALLAEGDVRSASEQLPAEVFDWIIKHKIYQ